MNTESIDLSVIVPAYNEAESLPQLLQELMTTLGVAKLSYEIIFIDDGSTDDTHRVLAGMVATHPQVVAYRLHRNRGKSTAYSIGFRASRGRMIATLDADLQDDPASLPVMLDALAEGVDMVVGWKQHRFRNEPTKALPSRVFNRLLRSLFGIDLQDSNSGFRVMRTDVAGSLMLKGDYYRFIPQIAHHAGFTVRETAVNHRRRRHGASKYGLARFMTGLLDAIALRFEMSFREKPLQAFGILATPFLATGAALQLYVLAMKLGGSAFLSHVAALLIGALCLMIGVQIVSVGLVGVLLSSRRAGDAIPTALVRRIQLDADRPASAIPPAAGPSH